jgi:GLPGLI family protein
MQHLFKIVLSTLLMAPFSQMAWAQTNTSGVIEYEVTARIDPERMRGFSGANGGGEASDLITFTQTFTFNNGMGKLETVRPAGFTGGRARGNNNNNGGGNGGNNSAGSPRRMNMGNNATYIDLANKKFIHVMGSPEDDQKSWYTEEDFTAPANVTTADKTKKIAGYACKKATVKMKEETYTVWYTTDLPFSFSPINGLLPDNTGVVMAAESSKRAFNAKSVNLKPVADSITALPSQAVKVSQEEMRDIRRQNMDKLRKRQEQLQ